ncbi:MAG: hypothetical protein E7265_05995 [Lachnospiraceae bacterium]|nr:hypothetical protein [Lachnospiraceae bacterium]
MKASHLRQIRLTVLATLILILGFSSCFETGSASTTKSAKKNVENSYNCDAFSVAIPNGYRTDTESIENYISIYNDDTTMGIRVENNTTAEDVTLYTEEKINQIIEETIGSLDVKAGENVRSAGHSIISFSNSGYPALYIKYEDGEGENSLYIEHYIITTVNYVYKLVFYSTKPDGLLGEDINIVKAGFTVNDSLITHAPPANTSSVFYIFIALASIIAIIFVVIIVYILRHNKHPNNSSKQ